MNPYKLLIIICAIVLLSACSVFRNESKYICVQTAAKDSFIDLDSIEGSTDSNVAMIFGKVINMDNEVLPYASILILDTNEIVINQYTTKIGGEFSLFLFPGVYQFRVIFIPSKKLDYTFSLSKGEKRRLNVVMGDPNGFTMVKPKRGHRRD